MPEHIEVRVEMGHGWQCGCVSCDMGSGSGPRQYCKCLRCGHSWRGKGTAMLKLPWPEYYRDFLEPEYCPSCETADAAGLPDWLVKNLAGAAYQYAVTYQNLPHYYTVDRNWPDYDGKASEEFRRTVWEMRKHEVERRFWGRKQHYLDVNGFTYWTMGSRTEETILINRQYSTHGAYASPFDGIAHRYDESPEPWWKVKGDREALYALAGSCGGGCWTSGAGRVCWWTTVTVALTARGTLGSIRARGCWRSSR